jgi:hypothetical protein
MSPHKTFHLGISLPTDVVCIIFRIESISGSSGLVAEGLRNKRRSGGHTQRHPYSTPLCQSPQEPELASSPRPTCSESMREAMSRQGTYCTVNEGERIAYHIEAKTDQTAFWNPKRR